MSALAADLNEMLALETRGLHNFLDEMTPYLSARTMPLWSNLRRMMKASTARAARITNLLAELDATVQAASFATDVARFQFLALEALLPHLLEEKQRQVAAAQRAVDNAAGRDGLGGRLDAMLADYRAELASLEQSALLLGVTSTVS